MNERSSNIQEGKHMKEAMELLGSIQKVDAPPFLLTRIRQRIEQVQAKAKKVSPVLAWSVACSLVLLLALNITVILRQSPANETEQLAQSMHMVTENSLYK